jgi:hypothetical protein
MMLAAVVVLAACKTSTEPVPTQIVVSPSSSLNFATLNRVVQLSAAMLDQDGDTMTGRTFTWLSNGSSIASVNDSGRVTAVGNGSTTITVSSGDVDATVNVTVAQVAAQASKNAGDNQIGNQGNALPSTVRVLVQDSAGLAAAGITVAFAVQTGGGSIAPASAVTDVNGLATGSWTLGSGTVNQTATATVGALPVLSFVANGIPAPAAGFQIHVLNMGPAFSTEVQAAFDGAVAFWQTAITGDISNVADFSHTAGQCFTGSPAMGPVTIDDVVIYARVVPIDGPNGVLGSAGPCYIRLNNGAIDLTILGSMRFDIDDMAGLVSGGSLNAVIRHEMGHVLGFGPFWPATVSGFPSFGCLQNAASAGNFPDTHFNCARAVAVFDSIGGTSYTGGSKVPVENCQTGVPASCGSGTFNSHWRESTFFNEGMTGYLNSGNPNPMSALTLAAMQDIGYTVNMAAAESYSRAFTAPAAFSGPLIDLSNDLEMGPLWGVEVVRGRAGRVRRVR